MQTKSKVVSFLIAAALLLLSGSILAWIFYGHFVRSDPRILFLKELPGEWASLSGDGGFWFDSNSNCFESDAANNPGPLTSWEIAGDSDASIKIKLSRNGTADRFFRCAIESGRLKMMALKNASDPAMEPARTLVRNKGLESCAAVKDVKGQIKAIPYNFDGVGSPCVSYKNELRALLDAAEPLLKKADAPIPEKTQRRIAEIHSHISASVYLEATNWRPKGWELLANPEVLKAFQKVRAMLPEARNQEAEMIHLREKAIKQARTDSDVLLAEAQYHYSESSSLQAARQQFANAWKLAGGDPKDIPSSEDHIIGGK
jgi:hypothetical protein